MINKLLQHIFDVNRKEDIGELLFFRIFEFFVCLFALQYIFQWASYIPKLKGVVLNLGIAQYIDITVFFNDYLPYGVAFLSLMFVVIGFFRLFKPSYLIVFILFHFQYAARFSQGEISHGSNIVGVCILALAVGYLVFKNETSSRRFVLGASVFFIGLGYTSAALCKLIATGPYWIKGQHLWLWLGERSTDVLSQTGHFSFNTLQKLILDNKVIATLILAFGLLSELMGFLFWFKKTRLFTGLILIGMHFGILESMNINFDKYIYILVLLTFPWDKLLNYLFKDKADKIKAKKRLLPH